jgi:hypothetical protein
MTKEDKRSVEVEIDSFTLRWLVRSEPKWSTEDGYRGLSLTVQRNDGAFRELILEYPFPEKRKMKIGEQTFLTTDSLPARSQISSKAVEADIRQAIAAGWDPASRGKAFVFKVMREVAS